MTFGVAMGAAYLVLSVLLWTLRGRGLAELPGRQWLYMAAVYMLGGGFVGVTLGAMGAGITSLHRAIGACIIGAVPLAIGFNSIFYPSAEVEYKDPVPRVIIFSIFFGVLGGVAYWQRRHDLE